MAESEQTGPDIEEDFGMDGYSVSGTEEGGQHHTAFSTEQGSAHLSWDTDKNGTYVEGSAHETLHDD